MKTGNKIRLGLFVLAGTLFLVLGLYYIGSKRNIFHVTINVSAVFNNVNGLLQGNNVRFNGINVGTVSAVNAVADTAVRVDFTIEEGVTPFISKNAVASIGTDGLLGNKLVNLTSSGGGKPVEEGDVLRTLNSMQTEAAMRTLSATNDNLKVISDNLKKTTTKLNDSRSLWNLLSDTAVAENIKSSVSNLKASSRETAAATGNLKDITEGIKKGKGSIGALLADTTLSSRLGRAAVNLEKFSDSAAAITQDLSGVTENMRQGKGSVGTLLQDTAMARNLKQSMQNINQGAKGFNENMEALKHTWPFKRYFRKRDKNKEK